MDIQSGILKLCLPQHRKLPSWKILLVSYYKTATPRRRGYVFEDSRHETFFSETWSQNLSRKFGTNRTAMAQTKSQSNINQTLTSSSSVRAGERLFRQDGNRPSSHDKAGIPLKAAEILAPPRSRAAAPIPPESLHQQL